MVPKENWERLQTWLKTVTGQEYMDELVWGSAGTNRANDLLKDYGIEPTEDNRTQLNNLADLLMSEGY